MSKIDALVQDFLAQKKIAVVGVSDKRDTGCNLGYLGPQWTDWFEGLTITLEDSGDTLVPGPVIDQAALRGLLKKVPDLGMPLVSVCPLEHGQAETQDVKL